MDDKIVLICATGRSGSTTMQRIINTIPNSNICGENYGAINSLLEFYRRVKYSTENNIPGHFNPASYESIVNANIKPAWYNSYNYNQILQMIKLTIINMFKNKTTTNLWGFKEIRYDGGNIKYIEDFNEIFHQTKFIIQFRENINAQSKSGWHKNNKNAVSFLKKTTKELIDFAVKNKSYCYLISFERMLNINHLRNMFLFIDCIDNFDETKVNEVLTHNINDK
jgi:hypothetical protein